MRILLPLFCFFIFSFNVPIENCKDIPDLNQQIISYLKTTLNKKVGRGECWDLAAEALNKTGADWDHDYKFGREVDPKRDCIFPGDIMQFKDVKLEYEENNIFYSQDMAHHTAIVYEVKSNSAFVVAQQNTGGSHGKKVSIDPLDLKNVKKGKIKFYRPLKNMK